MLLASKIRFLFEVMVFDSQMGWQFRVVLFHCEYKYKISTLVVMRHF